MSEELKAVFDILWMQDPEGLKLLLENASSNRLVLTPEAYALLKEAANDKSVDRNSRGA